MVSLKKRILSIVLLKILFEPKTEHVKMYLKCTKKKG